MADLKTKGTTRRAFLPALAGAAVAIPAAGMVITAAGEKPTSNPDAALFGAWQRFLAARDSFDVACKSEVVNGENPAMDAAQAEIWAAEAAFKSIPARTPEGFALKLTWMWFDIDGMAYTEAFMLDGRVPDPADIPYGARGTAAAFLEMIQLHRQAGAL